MTIRYRGLELQKGSPGYPILEAVENWLLQWGGLAQKDLLHRIRQAGFCFCETMFGCIACKGEHNMSPRNEFEQNVPLEENLREVPLTLGEGGPVIGTAIGKITIKDGNAFFDGKLNLDPETRRKLIEGTEPTPPLFSFVDPAEKYRYRKDTPPDGVYRQVDPDEVLYTEEYFRQNPDAPRTYREAWERQNKQQ